jgi:hypothetical protein
MEKTFPPTIMSSSNSTTETTFRLMLRFLCNLSSMSSKMIKDEIFNHHCSIDSTMLLPMMLQTPQSFSFLNLCVHPLVYFNILIHPHNALFFKEDFLIVSTNSSMHSSMRATSLPLVTLTFT